MDMKGFIISNKLGGIIKPYFKLSEIKSKHFWINFVNSLTIVPEL